MLLAQHNVFGLVEVEPHSIIVILTAIKDDGTDIINRGFGLEVEREIIPEGKKLSATVGVLIEPGKPNRIAFHDFSQSDDALPLVGDIPEVMQSITKALQQIRIKAFGETPKDTSKPVSKGMSN